MPLPRISPSPAPVPSSATRPPRAGAASFADSLRPAPSVPERLGEALEAGARSLRDRQAFVDRAIRRARHGGLDMGDLLALQAGVYRWAEEVQMASKLVNEVTQGVKTVLRSQS